MDVGGFSKALVALLLDRNKDDQKHSLKRVCRGDCKVICKAEINNNTEKSFSLKRGDQLQSSSGFEDQGYETDLESWESSEFGQSTCSSADQSGKILVPRKEYLPSSNYDKLMWAKKIVALSLWDIKSSFLKQKLCQLDFEGYVVSAKAPERRPDLPGRHFKPLTSLSPQFNLGHNSFQIGTITEL